MKTTTMTTVMLAACWFAAGPVAAAEEKEDIAVIIKTAMAKNELSKVDSILEITTDMGVIEVSLSELGATKNPQLVKIVLLRTLDNQLLWVEDLPLDEKETAAKGRILALTSGHLKKLGLAADIKSLQDEKTRTQLLKELKTLKLAQTAA